MTRRRLAVPLVLILLGILSSFPTLAQNENEEIGFSPTHTFDGGYFGDNIDILSGNLTFVTPIGPNYQVNRNLSYQLKLTYNFKVWEYLDTTGHSIQSKLWGESPLGIGFNLSFGRVYRDRRYVSGVGDDFRWYFVTPDGNKHDFGTALSAPITTNDLTYLDARMSGSNVIIRDKSGIQYTLAHRVDIPFLHSGYQGPCMDGSDQYPNPLCDPDWREYNAAFGGYYVTRIEDMTSGTETAGQYPNWIEIDYDTIGYGQCISHVRDSLGRSITFHNSLQVPGEPRSARTDSIDILRPSSAMGIDNSALAAYVFNFAADGGGAMPMMSLTVPRDFNPNLFDTKRRALRLESIEYHEAPAIPESRFKIRFDYYHESELVMRTLPMNDTADTSGSRIVYTPDFYVYYKEFFYRNEEFGKTAGTTHGVTPDGVARQVVKKDLYLRDPNTGTTPGEPVASWEYTRDSLASYTNSLKVIAKTVSGSLLNETVHFFHSSHPCQAFCAANAGIAPHDGYAPEWDDGLEFRTEYWEGPANSGRLMRTEDMTYESDTFPPNITKDNVRMVQKSTTFNDDGGKQITASYTDWDGFGHWRTVTESGFGMAAPRVTRTNYIKVTFVHAGGITDTKSDIYNYREVSDGNSVVTRSDYEYDAVGRLITSRDRKTSPPSAQTSASVIPESGDVITRITYDGQSGNVSNKSLAVGANTPTYTIAYTYNHPDTTHPSKEGPYLATKQFSPLAWKTIDWDRDGNTGKILTSRDPSGVATAYSYDDLGRVTRITPPSGTGAAEEWPTAVLYQSCDPDPPYACTDSLHETQVRQAKDPTLRCEDGVNANECIHAQYFYDDLARLHKTKKRNFDGSWVAQRSTFDGLSNVLSKSEWTKLNSNGDPVRIDGIPISGGNLVNGFPSTTYDYTDSLTGRQDAFGRAWKVTTADMQVTRTLYHGQDTTVTVERVNGLDNQPIDTTTSYTKDALGRLVDVSYPLARLAPWPIGPGGGAFPLTAAKAEYFYDLLDNLIQADIISPEGVVQRRSFYYDALSHLVREDNPENGTSLYLSYDPLGNLLQKQDSAGNVLGFLYDVAGRLSETSSGGNVLARNTYDTSAPGCTVGSDKSAGKLTQVESFGDAGELQVTQRYCSQGLNGRLSDEITAFSDWPGSANIRAQYTYNPYGLRARAIYPDEGIGRTLSDVTALYRNGFQTQLTDSTPGQLHVSGIEYNPAGGIYKIFLPGSNDLIFPDARNRPLTITISGYTTTPGPEMMQLLYSGQYIYDGAGNIARVGPNSYQYDEANRLIGAQESDNEHSTTYALHWAYDAWGNMTARSMSSSSGGGFGGTFTHLNNRITTMTYDARGNMTADGGHLYNYDLRNRLVRLDNTLAIPQGLFAYDAAGHRAKKTVNGTSTYYVRDQRGEVLSEFRKSAVTTFTPVWDRDYLYAAGRLVAEVENDAPHTPTGFTSRVSGGAVMLSWQAPADADIASYEIQRVGLPSTPTTVIFSSPGASYTDNTVTSTSQYFYSVKTVDTAGNKSGQTELIRLRPNDIANPASQTDPNKPSTPTITTITPGHEQIALKWNSATDNLQVLGYEVWRGAQLISPPTLQRQREIVDFGLQNGVAYTYSIYAVDTAGNRSNPPATATATPTDHVPPSPPSGLTAIPGCGATSNSIRLTWNPNPPSEGVVQYRIFRHAFGVSFDYNAPPLASVGGSVTSYEDSDFSNPGGPPPFTYEIRAVDGPNSTQSSNPASAALRVGSYSTPLVAYSGDGQVTLRWNGSTCTTPPCSFAVYRRLNMERDCHAYRRVGTVPFPSGAGASTAYSFTDHAAPNTIAYEYALAFVNGNQEETDFTAPVLAIPVERIKGVRRCRLFSDPSTDPCIADPNSNFTYAYRWNPPAATTYQPATASTLDSPQGYLKGYKSYRYSGGQTSGGLIWNPELGDGILTGRDGQYLPPVFPSQCRVITGIYKVPVNGNWLSVESDWSDNYALDVADPLLRCPGMPSLNSICSLPICSELDNIPSPTIVEALSLFSNEIFISWNPPTVGTYPNQQPYPYLAGYYLYVTEDTAAPGPAGLFRTDHPYLRLGPETTSISLNNLESCRKFKFYVATISADGRISDPSLITPLVQPNPGAPPPAGTPPTPLGVRVRLWTANDAIYKAAGVDDLAVIRVKFDPGCNSTATPVLFRCTNSTDPGVCSGVGSGSAGANEITVAAPIGETYWYRVRLVSGVHLSDWSLPVLGRVLPHDLLPLSPPNHVDAHVICSAGSPCDGANKVKLQWCPAIPEEIGPSPNTVKYRIFRSITPGGPYNDMTPVDTTNVSWTDPASLTPESKRYYYVVSTVRVVGAAETVSQYSAENGVGNTVGLNHWDPDSPEWGNNTWPPTEVDWPKMHCNDDVVRKTPQESIPTEGGEQREQIAGRCIGEAGTSMQEEAVTDIQQPAPYRAIGTITVVSHYTYYHLDHLGSPRILTNSLGVRMQGQHFMPFGEEIPIESGVNTRKFTGHERDTEIGLDYMFARYYEASLGRFLAADPGNDRDLGDPQTWNMYTYVRNNPVNATDPDGRFKAYGKFAHEGMTADAGMAVAAGGKLSIGDVVGGAVGMDMPWGRWWGTRDHPAHYNRNRSIAAPGTPNDTRMQIGTDFIVRSLEAYQKGQLIRAGYRFGEALHCFQDTVNHQNITPQEHSTLGVDDPSSKGFMQRYTVAANLTKELWQIMNDAMAAISSGADLDTVTSETTAKVQKAVEEAASAVKTTLQTSGPGSPGGHMRVTVDGVDRSDPYGP